jgi:4-amino-4-deoxy-L-arabinose transferase-like glycosyltransferase
VSVRENLSYFKENFSSLWNGEKKEYDWRFLFALLIFAFLIRIPLLIYPEVIHNDGTAYIGHAKRILSGDWSVGKTHPFYPGLIALFHFFTPNEEIAGILVSVIFGALIVLPIFYLGKVIFDEKVGVLSALFATVHPFLYTPSGSVLTESTFHFLLATSVLFGWKAFDGGRFRDILLFSLFTCFSYLTRPEGIGFLLIFGAWVLLINPPKKRRPWTKRAVIILLTIFSFLLFSFPYLLQLRKETGRWQISKKVSVSIGSSSEEADLPVEMIRVKKEISFSSLLKSPMSVVKKMGIGFLDSLYKFQQVYTPLLSLLLILGLILNKGKFFSIKGNLYLLSYFVYFFAFIHPFFWVTRRYTSHVVSIALPWAAVGFVEMTSWVRKRFQEEKFQRKFPATLLLIILIVLFAQGRVIHPREHRVIQREVGFWMRDHLPKGATLMSPLPQEAFYAERPWVRMPRGSYEEILKEARSKDIRYLVIDEDVEKDSPGFLEKSKQGDLVPVFDLKRKDRRIVVFEIVYPK